VINRNVNPNQIVALFTTTTTAPNAHQAGTEDPAHTFTLRSTRAMADWRWIPPVTERCGTARIRAALIVQMTNTGTILRQISIGLQAPGSNIGVSGLAFDASGDLLVATNQGNVLRLNVNEDAASLTPQPTLTSSPPRRRTGRPRPARRRRTRVRSSR